MTSYWYLQLWSSTAGFILAFPLSSLSLLSLTVRNLAPIVCILYSYLFNPIIHVVSELLTHISMKNKILTRILCFCRVVFVFSLVDSSQNIIFQSYWGQFFFSLLDPILIFSKHFHIWLHLWSYHYCCVREDEAMTCGGWIGCLWSRDQLGAWLELGTLGYAGPHYFPWSYCLQDGPGPQRQLLHGMSGQMRRSSMAEPLVLLLIRQSSQVSGERKLRDLIAQTTSLTAGETET